MIVWLVAALPGRLGLRRGRLPVAARGPALVRARSGAARRRLHRRGRRRLRHRERLHAVAVVFCLIGVALAVGLGVAPTAGPRRPAWCLLTVPLGALGQLALVSLL